MSGVFIGYALQSGGGWTGDLFVAEWEDIKSAYRFTYIHVKRFKAQEVNASQINGQFRFLCADGSLKQDACLHWTRCHHVRDRV